MKVLIFMTEFCRLYGAERLAVELAEELNKRGIHADILSMYGSDLPRVAEAKDRLLRKGIPKVHFLNMRIHPPAWSLVPAIMKLRRLIRQNEYDIVETSMRSPTVIASLATRGTRARHVAGLHHVFTREEHNSKNDRLWRLSVRCNPRLRYYAISDCAARSWISYSKTPAEYTRTIYNAIPNDCFEIVPDRCAVRAELGVAQETRLALYVGRLAAYKGLDTLLQALGPILEQENVVLLYVGQPNLNINGTRDMLQQIRQEVAGASWGDRVRFLGYRDDVPRLMAAGDILVHPTRTEGFGLVLVEALAAGLPVVASDVGGIPEVLAGTDSIMVPPNDPCRLRNAVLKTLHRMPKESAQAVERGRQRAETFRIAKRIDSMIEFFEDVLGGGPNDLDGR